MIDVKSNEQNKTQCKIEIITDVYPGRNDRVRAVTMRNGSST